MLRLHPEIYAAVVIESQAQKLDPYLVGAVMMCESAGQPNAVDKERCGFGLMQLDVRGAGANIAPMLLLDIANNVRLGTAFLAECIDHTGSEADGVSAYNQGLGGWMERGQAGNPAYVEAVLTMRQTLASGGMGRIEPPDLWVRWE